MKTKIPLIRDIVGSESIALNLISKELHHYTVMSRISL